MKKAAALTVLGIVVVVIPILSQQFEVASVKVHPPPVSIIGITNRGGRFSATGFSLKMLVGRGYGIPETRILGAPNWAESERYDIEAKAPDGATPNQLQPMIQGMLKDRFELKAHKETRDLPVYELTVVKGGLKMKLSADQTPPVPAAPAPLPDRGGVPRGDRGTTGRGQVGLGQAAGPRQRGTQGFTINNGRYAFEGNAITLQAIINAIQQRVDRPIIDKTVLSGLFDVNLEWSPGAEAPPQGFGPLPPDVTPPAPGDGPTIFSALQDQLGLRLEGAKGPVEVLIIDDVQKPSEN
jgi:uncharacterized protein (TIGR03435 family)